MKLGIITTEPKNFVPVKLHEEAVAAGLEATILDMAKLIHVESDKSKIYYDGKPLELDYVIPRLSETSIEVKLGLLTRLEKHGVKLLNSSTSMALCNDKLETQIVLNDMSIKTPWSAVAHSGEELEHVVKLAEEAGLKFPMILKTLRGTHGIGVMKVDSKASLISVAQALIAEKQQLMVQEFIEHEQSYRIIMIGDELLAANERGQPKDKDEFRTNSHLGSETKRYTPGEDELEVAKKIVATFGCNFCAIDYIKVDSGLLVLEVNGSPGLEAIQKDWEGELNLPQLVIKYVAAQDSVAPVGASQEAPAEQPAVEAEPTAATEPVAVAVEEPKDVPPAEGSKPPEVSIDVGAGTIELDPPPALEVPTEVTADKSGETIGDFEQVTISRLIDTPVEARVDTGAKLSSVHAENVKIEHDWVWFTRGSINYKVPVVRMAKIRSAQSDLTVRPVVHLDITIKGKHLQQVEFTIVGREAMKYEVLIGRNVLGMLGIPIVVPMTAEPGTTASQIEVEEE